VPPQSPDPSGFPGAPIPFVASFTPGLLRDFPPGKMRTKRVQNATKNANVIFLLVCHQPLTTSTPKVYAFSASPPRFVFFYGYYLHFLRSLLLEPWPQNVTVLSPFLALQIHYSRISSHLQNPMRQVVTFSPIPTGDFTNLSVLFRIRSKWEISRQFPILPDFDHVVPTIYDDTITARLILLNGR
jgi:hypothetical protein